MKCKPIVGVEQGFDKRFFSSTYLNNSSRQISLHRGFKDAFESMNTRHGLLWLSRGFQSTSPELKQNGIGRGKNEIEARREMKKYRRWCSVLTNYTVGIAVLWTDASNISPLSRRFWIYLRNTYTYIHTRILGKELNKKDVRVIVFFTPLFSDILPKVYIRSRTQFKPMLNLHTNTSLKISSLISHNGFRETRWWRHRRCLPMVLKHHRRVEVYISCRDHAANNSSFISIHLTQFIGKTSIEKTIDERLTINSLALNDTYRNYRWFQVHTFYSRHAFCSSSSVPGSFVFITKS